MPVDDTLYKLLNVRPDAGESEIKKSYYKLAKEFHPDKNPQNGEKFKEISFAYEVLSNPERRALYDRRGVEGLKEAGTGSGSGMFDGADILEHLFGGGGGGSPFGGGFFGGGGGLFSHMFGGGGGPRRRRDRGEDAMHQLGVTLEDLYNGKVSKLQISKNVLCSVCDGAGGKPGSEITCQGCRGQGMRMVVREIGPGMITQSTSVCPDCKGEGKSIPVGDRCYQCKGAKTVKETKQLEVHIDKGMREGQKIYLRGEGDQEPGIKPGDIIIVLATRAHERFKRQGDNLMMHHTITLADALCGVRSSFQHLDGRTVVVYTKPGDVVDHEATRCVVGEGMPRHRDPQSKGNLYIKFRVEFPPDNFADEKSIQMLEKLLPARPKERTPPSDADVEEVNLVPFEEHAGASSSKQAYDDDSEDDDEGGGAPRVACASQ